MYHWLWMMETWLSLSEGFFRNGGGKEKSGTTPRKPKMYRLCNIYCIFYLLVVALGGLLNLLIRVLSSVKWVTNHNRSHSITILDELVHVECLELSCTFCILSIFRGHQLYQLLESSLFYVPLRDAYN